MMNDKMLGSMIILLIPCNKMIFHNFFYGNSTLKSLQPVDKKS